MVPMSMVRGVGSEVTEASVQGRMGIYSGSIGGSSGSIKVFTITS